MSSKNFESEEEQLDALFSRYRSVCPDVEPSANFMPELWNRIEGRRSLWFRFSQLGKNALAVSAALCLVLLALNLSEPPQVAANYADALLSDDSTQQVFYSEAIPPATPTAGGNQTISH
jgi:hypothetical protein